MRAGEECGTTQGFAPLCEEEVKDAEALTKPRGPEPEVGRNQCGQSSAGEDLWGSDGEDKGATKISLPHDLVQLSPGWD